MPGAGSPSSRSTHRAGRGRRGGGVLRGGRVGIGEQARAHGEDAVGRRAGAVGAVLGQHDGGAPAPRDRAAWPSAPRRPRRRAARWARRAGPPAARGRAPRPGPRAGARRPRARRCSASRRWAAPASLERLLDAAGDRAPAGMPALSSPKATSRSTDAEHRLGLGVLEHHGRRAADEGGRGRQRVQAVHHDPAREAAAVEVRHQAAEGAQQGRLALRPRAPPAAARGPRSRRGRRPSSAGAAPPPYVKRSARAVAAVTGAAPRPPRAAARGSPPPPRPGRPPSGPWRVG